MAKDDVDKCSKAYRESAAFKRASFHPPDEIWGMFADADGFMDVLCTFQALVDSLNIDQNVNGLEFYKILKSKLTSWKCQSLWDLLNARVKCSEYRHENVSVGKNMRCIIIGAGPIGLRTAIEMLMLGCRTVVVEKRKDFSRNNVLHLWPFLLHDFRTLGAKKFYGKFGAGCIDHINIKTLQTILLKIALVLGVEIYNGVEFKDIIEPNEDHGWRACFDPVNHENLSKQDFDVIIGADGKKNVLPGFAQVELRGSLAIGITCNFINNNTPEETSCKEISGISYQFKPAFFEELKTKHGVELENIVYYKDETHYFVMTARKPSLLEQGVILKDYADPILLVKPTNINKTKLLEYTRNAVRFSTTLSKLEFKKLPNGQPDIALFDFTSLKKAENASRIIERNKHKLLLALVGDSLIEPFWPTGSGCGRGVLSALDVAWMVRQFALNYPPLAMIRERENVFKLLSASTHDNTQKNYSLYTIDPKTRYSALDTKKITNLDSLKSLYDTDDLSADLTLSSPSLQPKYYTKKRTVVERKKSGGGGASRPSGRTVAGKTKRKLERQESKTTKNEEKKLSIKDKKDVFEEHIKKMGMGTDVPKPKRATTSDEFSGLEGIDEDINESDDDVMVDEEPSTKKKIGQDKNASLKKQTSKDPGETTKGKVLKRTPSKESVKRQGSKSLKRQSSKEGELSELDPISEDMPSTRKKVFHAKGGGLKSKTRNESRKSSEKSDSGKTRHKSTKRKSRKSAGSSSEIEASRYSNSLSSVNSIHNNSRNVRNNKCIERKLLNRKSEAKKGSAGIVKRKSLTKKPNSAHEISIGKNKIREYIKLFEENCGSVPSIKPLTKSQRASLSSYSSSLKSRSGISNISSISHVKDKEQNLLTDSIPHDSCSQVSNALINNSVASDVKDLSTAVENVGCNLSVSVNVENSSCITDHTNLSQIKSVTYIHEGTSTDNTSTFINDVKREPQRSSLEINQCAAPSSSNENQNYNFVASDSLNMDGSLKKMEFTLNRTTCSEGTLLSVTDCCDAVENETNSVNDSSNNVCENSNNVNEKVNSNNSLCSVSNVSCDSMASDISKRELKRTATRTVAKVRRSTSIRRSKFGKLDKNLKRKESPNKSMNTKTTMTTRSSYRRSVQTDTVQVNRKQTKSLSSEDPKTNTLKDTSRSFKSTNQLKKRNTRKAMSESSDTTTSLSISSITNSSLSMKSNKTRNGMKRKSSICRTNYVNTKPDIKKHASQANRPDVKFVQPTWNSTSKISNAKLAKDKAAPTRSVTKKTRTSRAKSNCPVLNLTTEETYKVNNNKIEICITDDANNTKSLDVMETLETQNDSLSSSEQFSINYDAKLSPVIKRSRKRRNAQCSAIKKKTSNIVSPSRKLSKRRKKASEKHCNIVDSSLHEFNEKNTNYSGAFVFNLSQGSSLTQNVSNVEVESIVDEENYHRKLNISKEETSTFSELTESTITSMDTQVLSEVNPSGLDSFIKEDISHVLVPQDDKHLYKKENRTIATERKMKNSHNNKQTGRKVCRSPRVCPLGKTSPTLPAACGAIGKFLNKSNRKRRNSSILNSILEEE